MAKTNIFERLGLKEDKPVIVTSKFDFEGNGTTVIIQGTIVRVK